ncbi:FAD-dependent oxidoreductase [uncultured Zhongshania sp.]|uniref:FAD-dependent oxidoreductase n=1 Tax=uncultured Zhongshania sp. TaxID=1642288 RepID=UPI0025D7973D|nr:FAD-dependent oxidoreductase [uncultured Zhongshania sp.]
MTAPPPNKSTQELVLVGGGHAHVQVLKLWGRNPIKGVSLTLISPQQHTPYSGMLPGLIAGHYQMNETHIDLAELCHFAGAKLIQGSVSQIDLRNKELQISNGAAVKVFDWLSINSGITPDLHIPGTTELTTAVKPISEFYPRWQHILQELDNANTKQSIAIVGGGAAGVELVLAMRHAISERQSISVPVTLHLVFRGNQALKDFPRRIRKRCETALEKANIHLHRNCHVSKLSKGEIHCTGTTRIPADFIVLCTHAAAPSWPKTSGLATDIHGFISIEDTLQSRSHPYVFAAGDIAQQTRHPRPHAGVFAVRQGPVLFNNLQRALQGKPLHSHHPQRDFLSILALGGQSAIAYRRFWPALQGNWVWRWKDAIDRRFMTQFGSSKILKRQH